MLQDVLNAVATEYDLTIKQAKVMRDRKKSYLVKLETTRGHFLLKRLNITEMRQRFILSAEQFLRAKGVKIPRTLRTKKGHLYFMHGGYPYVIMKWIKGKSPPPATTSRIKEIGRLLGQFHAKSIGFQSDLGNRYSSANSWEHEYLLDIYHMEEWFTAHAATSSSRENAIKKQLHFFLRAARSALHALDQTAFFHEWKKTSHHLQYLCHGDFHTANIISNRSGSYLIDWEDVRYDFPSKDLSRFLQFIMRHEGGFSSHRWNLLWRAYQSKNRLTKKEKKLFYIDLSFPHAVERFLRKRAYMNMKRSAVDRFLKQERQKITYMKRQWSKL